MGEGRRGGARGVGVERERERASERESKRARARARERIAMITSYKSVTSSVFGSDPGSAFELGIMRKQVPLQSNADKCL